MFRRVLVANRGEIALRIIRACDELGVEIRGRLLHGRRRLSARPDGGTPQVWIGPPDPRRSYLSIPNVIAAAKNSGCEADPSRLRLPLREHGIRRACAGQRPGVHRSRARPAWTTWGTSPWPSASWRRPGYPPSPAVRDAVAAVAEALRLADEVGYPVMLKASAGGGGRGMRLVEDPADLERHFLAASAEAEAAFGNGALYLEKVIVRPAPRRGAGARRRPGRGPDAGRARLLHPAPPPEGAGGVALAAAGPAGPARAPGGWSSGPAPRSATRAPAPWSSWSTRTSASTSWR